MSSVWEQPWFWPVAAVVVGLPVLLLVLTEAQSTLARRGSPAAKVVGLLRNFILPAAAILILVAQVTASIDSDDFTWTRIVATALGFLVILFVLNSVNLALFTNARRGSWRDRLPSIFVDIGRLLLIVIGLAVLFSVVWGTDVGGLFTALGVGSIVIGLALQGAIGSVVSGLLLLFEAPFRLGDWVDTGDARGRVVEVNWRAVHIDTGNGIRITPNAALAGSSFTNLSRSSTYTVTVPVTFTTDDPPLEVCRLLRQIADDLPEKLPGTTSAAVALGGGAYEVGFDVATPGVETLAVARLRTWLWYAARRTGLALDGDATDAYSTPENIAAALKRVSATLRISGDDAEALAPVSRLERFAAGEVIARAGSVPDGIRLILRGSVTLSVGDGVDALPIGRVDDGDILGQSAVTREPALATATAATEVALLALPVAAVDELLRRKPAFAREIGRVIDRRRSEVQELSSGARSTTRPLPRD